MIKKSGSGRREAVAVPTSRAALLARSTFMGDVPTGAYYFDHRARPISTQQFGNTQITVNPSSVAASSSLWVGYEYIAQASQVVFAGSLPSGG